MKYNNSEISLYTDSLIVATIIENNVIIKKADGVTSGLVLSLIDKVKGYVSNHIDPHDRVGSLINILSPGTIATVFSAMGLGWFGALIGLAMRIFNIDVYGIINSIWDKLKPTIGNDKPISSSQIDAVVQNSVQEHYKPATPEEAEKAVNMMEVKSFSQLMRDAKLVKLTMIGYESGILIKEAGFFSMFSDRKSKTISILARVLSWIFKIALASAGLVIAGDVVNKFLGRPNAFDNTIQKGKPVPDSPPPSTYISKQTKFPVKSNYIPEKYNIGESVWMENILNNDSSIENMLINFTKNVYDGLDGKENIISSSPAFQVVKDRISWYNRTSPNAPMIFIPKYFNSKKQIVDYFIDDIAEKIK